MGPSKSFSPTGTKQLFVFKLIMIGFQILYPFFVQVNRHLGLSPGHYTKKLAKLRDSTRLRQRAVATTIKIQTDKISKEIKNITFQFITLDNHIIYVFFKFYCRNNY